MKLNKEEFLDRAQAAFYARVPASLVLYYRERLDLKTAVNGRFAPRTPKAAVNGRFARDLLAMEPVFARLAFCQAARDPALAGACAALVACYVLARGRVARRRWTCPEVGGVGDRDLDDACLHRLLELG